KRCEVEISIRALFERPRRREFAAAVDAARASGAGARHPPESTAEEGTRAEEPATLAPGAHPLSYPQRQLLFFDQLTPGSVTYNTARATRVVGPLNVSALHGALTEMFRRQEALRTVLVWSAQATPSQVVLDEWDVELPVIDLSELAGEEQEGELARLLTEPARRP